MLQPKRISTIGYGAVGRLKTEMFHTVFPDATVLAYDTQEIKRVPEYVRMVGSVQEAITNADLIIHTESASAMVGSIEQSRNFRRKKDAVEIHGCSIQGPAYNALRRVANFSSHTVLGTHLMSLPPENLDGLTGKRFLYTTTNDQEMAVATELDSYLSRFGLEVLYKTPLEHDRKTGITQGFSLSSVVIMAAIFAQNPKQAYFPFITDGPDIVEDYTIRLDGKLALMSIGRFSKISEDTVASIICLNPYVAEFVSKFYGKNTELVADMGDKVEERYQKAREFVGQDLLKQALERRKIFVKDKIRARSFLNYPGDGRELYVWSSEDEVGVNWKAIEGVKNVKRLCVADAIAFTETMQESDLTLDDVDFAATTGYNLKLAGIAEALCNEELNFPTGPLVTPLPTKFSESTLFMNFILSGSDPEKIPTIRNEFVRKPLEAFPLELRKRWFDESQEVLSWIG